MLRFRSILRAVIFILGGSVLSQNASYAQNTFHHLNKNSIHTQSYSADLKPIASSQKLAKVYWLPDYHDFNGDLTGTPSEVDQCAVLCSGYSKGVTSCPEGYTLEKCPKSGCGTYGRCVNNCPATVTLSSAEICLETCGGNCVKKEVCSYPTTPNSGKTACVCPSQYQKSCPANSVKGTSTCSVNGETYVECFCKPGYKCNSYISGSSQPSCKGSCVTATVCKDGKTYYETYSQMTTAKNNCLNENGKWVQNNYNISASITAFCGKCTPKTCAEINSGYQESPTSTDGKSCTKLPRAPTSAGQTLTCYKCTCPETVEIPSNGYCAQKCGDNCVKAITCESNQYVSNNSCVCRSTSIDLSKYTDRYCVEYCNGNCVKTKYCSSGQQKAADGKSCVCKAEVTLKSNQRCVEKCDGKCTQAQDCPAGKRPNADKTSCETIPCTKTGYSNTCTSSQFASETLTDTNGAICKKCVSNSHCPFGSTETACKPCTFTDECCQICAGKKTDDQDKCYKICSGCRVGCGYSYGFNTATKKWSCVRNIGAMMTTNSSPTRYCSDGTTLTLGYYNGSGWSRLKKETYVKYCKGQLYSSYEALCYVCNPYTAALDLNDLPSCWIANPEDIPYNDLE